MVKKPACFQTVLRHSGIGENFVRMASGILCFAGIVKLSFTQMPIKTRRTVDGNWFLQDLGSNTVQNNHF